MLHWEPVSYTRSWQRSIPFFVPYDKGTVRLWDTASAQPLGQALSTPRVTLFSPSPSPPTATPCASSPADHTALLVVAADLLQSASRGDHPELIEPLHALITSVAR